MPMFLRRAAPHTAYTPKWAHSTASSTVGPIHRSCGSARKNCKMRSVAANVPQSAPLSVRERILSSFHCSPSTSGRACCPAHGLPAARRQSTTCAASKAAKSGKSGGGQGFKGFGEAPKPAPQQQKRDLSFERDSDEELVGPAAAAAQQLGDEDYNEIRLKPAYQMYVDAGFKAQRYIAPSLALTRPEGK